MIFRTNRAATAVSHIRMRARIRRNGKHVGDIVMAFGTGKRNVDALEAERGIPTLGCCKSLAQEPISCCIDGSGHAAARDQNLLSRNNSSATWLANTILPPSDKDHCGGHPIESSFQHDLRRLRGLNNLAYRYSAPHVRRNQRAAAPHVAVDDSVVFAAVDRKECSGSRRCVPG